MGIGSNDFIEKASFCPDIEGWVETGKGQPVRKGQVKRLLSVKYYYKKEQIFTRDLNDLTDQ